MERTGALREVWRRGVAMNEAMQGSSQILPWLGSPGQILPQQQAPLHSSCSTAVSCHFQPIRRVRQHSSDSISLIPRSGPVNPNSSKQIDAGVESKIAICNQKVRMSPDGGARLLSDSNATHGKSGTTVKPAYIVLEQARSCQNGAHPALHNYPVHAGRIVASVIRQTSGVTNLYNPSLYRVQQEILTFRDECSLQKMATRLYMREAQSPDRKYRREAKALAGAQGVRRRGNNVTQLEAASPQPRSGAAKCRESSKIIEANRNASHKVVGEIQSIDQNADSLKLELERVGEIKANLTRSRGANETLEIREQEPLAREEEGQSSAISEQGVTENRQDLLAEEMLRKAHRVDGRSTPAWTKVGLNLTAQGRLQSRASDGTRNWSQVTEQGNGSTHMDSAGTTSEAIAVIKNRLQRGINIASRTYVKVLQMCSKQKNLSAAMQVHDCTIRSGMHKNPHVAIALLNMYIRCGRCLDARRVFDELEKKSHITWNSMIGGYARCGDVESALELCKLMRQDGAGPNEFTYLSILKACASPLALTCGKQVHDCIRYAGFESDVRVGTALLQMYAKCGCLPEARRVFENLTNRNSVTWNIMIGSYAESSHGVEAYELFLQMRREGFEPDAFTYTRILNASAGARDLEWVKEIHGHASRAGLESDLRVGTALVHMYAKGGSIDDARLVFDRLGKRDLVTWNVMIGGLAQHGCGYEAYRLFLRMRCEGFEPDAFTFANILNASASAGALEWVKEVHGHARKAGLEFDLRVGNALIHMYSKSGSLNDARLVFDRLKTVNVSTWTIMIGAYSERGYGAEAYRLFLQMGREGFEPTAITYTSILNASASAGALEWVKVVHGHARKAGLESDLRVGAALVHMYAKSGSIDDAVLVFDRMEKRDVVTWNVMIGGLAQHGCGREAYRLLLQMRREGFEPDAFTFASILNASASAGALEWVREVHVHASKAGLESDLRVGNALVHMYADSGSIDDARRTFDRMEKRDVVTWNSIIGGLAQHGCGHEAYKMFLQMQREGFAPDAITFASILNTSASAGHSEWVKEVHGHASKAGLELDLRVGNALVHMYAESGSIDDARQVFDRMEKRDVVTWNVMIGGLAHHGHGHEALARFREMQSDRVKPDGTSFVAVLSACCHAGLLDDGQRLFLAMTQDYGIVPDIVHYTCMVDLVGRAGHLEEAKRLISEMPVEPDVVTWTALLGACRTYGNVELGELAAEEIFKLKPMDTAGYVLLSNIYAAAGRWEDVSLVRTTMQKRGVRKEPGRSWIEVDNKIHEFVVGDTSHPEAKVIYSELQKLTEMLKAEGYVPDTRLVLHDINEEFKELTLCSHSEKLAIAYGLMHIPPGEPIRVRKNLRVCPDCHTATKFISKVTGREIIARDANRFHHFKDGLCSCGDYW